MTNFTPFTALIGGALIGLSATMLLLFLGRIAGVSGILASSMTQAEGRVWRLCFLVGLVLGAFLVALSHVVPAELRQDYPRALLIIGGILVGYGTRLGSGCTSGHGICGLARFSMRSLLATLVFMLTAMITVFVIRHLMGVAA